MRRIVQLGNAQLVEQGVAGLSVREIARGLGMVSSAIYRYVRSRDDLLTLLIMDAFGDLADAVDAGVAGAGADPRQRFLALGEAMTNWAVANPERWALLYGTPVREYAAPADSTNEPGTRVIGQVLAIAGDAARTNAADAAHVHASSSPPALGLSLDPAVAAMLDASAKELGVAADPATAVRAVTAWSGLVGAISAHLFGQLGPDAVAVGEQLLVDQTKLLADLIVPH